MSVPGLSDREAQVLRHVIHSYILTANPVGSRSISKLEEVSLSPATIRNAMADLEEKGLLTHPHTSAGREPTDKGYRLYVNYLMTQERITPAERQLIDRNVDELMPDVEAILGRTAHLLSQISRNLGVVLSPVFDHGRLERLDLVPLGRNRLLVVVTVASGLARTVTLEIERTIDPDELPHMTRVIQQRLCGLTLREIRETIHERLADVRDAGKFVARLFIDSTERLFTVPRQEGLILEGARNILDVPEFKVDGYRSVLEILEDRQMVLHLLSQHIEDGLSIHIGKEIEEAKVRDYSLISAGYQVGSLPGILGIIGPRRMNYSRLISLVKYTADLINRKLRSRNAEVK